MSKNKSKDLTFSASERCKLVENKTKPRQNQNGLEKLK